MNRLSKAFLSTDRTQGAPPELIQEKVLQFGTGVLLRGLPDFIIDRANQAGVYQGSIVMVKSTDGGGDIEAFREQDGLYTVAIKGWQTEENVVCSAISRVLAAATAWDQVLKCAANPHLELVVSNTTEVGIQLRYESIFQTPPSSFPAKLLAFLYARYQHFEGNPEKGLIIIPTELIPDNGSQLGGIIRELARHNQLEDDFISWLSSANAFCNSLVDRIVPGHPLSEDQLPFFQSLGYRDDLAIIAEPYYLWAIEGDEPIKNRLSFNHINPERIIIAPDITPYRELKLRLLNGLHTFSCALAYLCGMETVGQAMQHPQLGAYITRLVQDELIPAMPQNVPTEAATRFAHEVLDRFRNPYIRHFWINISLQYSSKMRMRNVALIKRYAEVFSSPPPLMSLGFAAYLLFMRVAPGADGNYYGQHRSGYNYRVQDDQAPYFYHLWQQQRQEPERLVREALGNIGLWGSDLNLMPGLTQSVSEALRAILADDSGLPAQLEQQLLVAGQTI
jgi:tagaturonate reductase